jgi:aminopeptidase N
MPAFSIDEGVSRTLARDRARLVSNVRYKLSIELRKRAARMPGHIAIQFELAATPADPLPLDFRDLDSTGKVIEGSARGIKVNGSAAEPARSNGHILIPGKLLHRGANQIEMDFDSAIAEANRAVTRYIDSEDGSEYLYTLFVPMDASLAFPCFDQPDLKARFTLEVTLPSDWIVVSNNPPNHTIMIGGFAQRWFPETRPISTYLFAFAAGPFERLEAQSDKTPLALYVRRSMMARAKEEWPALASVMRQGMARMVTFFDQPFPFEKYDEVVLPGFAYGGMEHAGATFLNEDVVLFKSAPTINDRNRRELTMLHEMAHQWFGDLVTMRWFDDLWLKEGFAQYMAYQTQAELGDPETVWKRFYESIKPVAYQIDGTHGTTPIYQQIPNLKDAKSAYGAIVYQKAPSLLHLLAFDIGEVNFRQGVRTVLREHAYANAEWSDLIEAFSRASGKNLTPWANAWVQQRGMPQIEIAWACDSNQRISSFELSQKDALDEGHLWPIRTQILFGYADGEPVVLTAALDAAKALVPEAIGKNCPAYVFGNNEDHAYGRFLLDERSRAAITLELPRIANPFQRTLLWGAVWDSVRESRMPPLDYAELALRLLPSEKDAELAISILGHLRTTYTSYLSEPQRAAFAVRLEDLLTGQMTEASSTDLRISNFRALVAVGTTGRARGVLKDLFAGRTTIPDVPLKQRDRWNIIAALTALNDAAGPEYLTAERQRDQTEDGRKYAYVAGAGLPQPENKRKYFAEYLAPGGVPEDWVTASLPVFNYWNQTALTLGYVKPALDALPQMKRERKIFFVLNWLDSFVENQDSPEALKAVDDFLAGTSADPDLRLKILEARDELARTVRIRSLTVAAQ